MVALSARAFVCEEVQYSISALSRAALFGVRSGGSRRYAVSLGNDVLHMLPRRQASMATHRMMPIVAIMQARMTSSRRWASRCRAQLSALACSETIRPSRCSPPGSWRETSFIWAASTMATTSRYMPDFTFFALKCTVPSLSRVICESAPSKCSHTLEFFAVTPSGKVTVPVTSPIGTVFLVPIGSHWNAATSS